MAGERFDGKINGFAVTLEPGTEDLKVQLTLPWSAVESVRTRRGCALIQAGNIHIPFDSDDAAEAVALIHQLVPELAAQSVTPVAAPEPPAAADASSGTGWRRRLGR